MTLHLSGTAGAAPGQGTTVGSTSISDQALWAHLRPASQMDLVHRQEVRGARPGIDEAQLLAVECAGSLGKEMTGGGQRGARRVRGRAGGGVGADPPLFEELDLIHTPGLPQRPLPAFGLPVPCAPAPSP